MNNKPLLSYFVFLGCVPFIALLAWFFVQAIHAGPAHGWNSATNGIVYGEHIRLIPGETQITTGNGGLAHIVNNSTTRLSQLVAQCHIDDMRKDGSLTNVVNLLFSTGVICEVRGHTWGQHMHLTLEYYSDGRPECRQCTICGKHQTKSP